MRTSLICVSSSIFLCRSSKIPDWIIPLPFAAMVDVVVVVWGVGDKLEMEGDGFWRLTAGVDKRASAGTARENKNVGRTSSYCCLHLELFDAA